MSQDSSPAVLTEWVREHATVLSSLDPDSALDELEPLRGIVGDARILGLGEGCHFVREFTMASQPECGHVDCGRRCL